MVRLLRKAPLLAAIVLTMALGPLPATTRGQDATPASTEVQSTNSAAKVLRIGRESFPDTFDPQTTTYSFAVPSLVFEGLTRQDEHLNTVPAAAESWEFSDDGTVLTFHLRDELTYSDGSPLTAERFRYAIERNCDPRTESPYVNFIFAIAGCEAWATSLEQEIEEGYPSATPVVETEAADESARANLGVKALDDQTLEIQLSHPAAYLPTVASTWLFYPIQQEIVEADPEGWWSDAASWVSNGPFAVSEIDAELPGQSVSFVANEHYWAGQPKLDGIEYHYFDEDEYGTEALAAYTRGDLDMIYAPYPYGSQPEIADDPRLSQELLRYPLAVTSALGFDHRQEPFQDQQVRAAFAYGLDRESYCQEIWLGACVPTLTWIPAGVPGHIESDKFAYDPEAAREALANSTYGGPENLPEIIYRYDEGDSEGEDIGEWLAANYQESLGVEITVVPTTDEEWEAFDAAEAVEQLGWWGWTQDYPDPQNWLSVVWACETGFFASQIDYCNPELDALVEQADQETDPATRLALYEEAGRLLVEDVPMVFSFNDTQAVLVKPYVTGYVTTPRDNWPGWTTPLTIDLEQDTSSISPSTPVS